MQAPLHRVHPSLLRLPCAYGLLQFAACSGACDWRYPATLTAKCVCKSLLHVMATAWCAFQGPVYIVHTRNLMVSTRQHRSGRSSGAGHRNALCRTATCHRHSRRKQAAVANLSSHLSECALARCSYVRMCCWPSWPSLPLVLSCA